MKTLNIYTDGGCSKNGAGSWAFALSKSEYRCGKSNSTTNNRMELTAIIKAIEYAKNKGFDKLTIFSDSKYCVDGFNIWSHNWIKNDWVKSDGYEVRNYDLWITLNEHRDKNITLVWVKGHSNNEMNQFVDSLCVN